MIRRLLPLLLAICAAMLGAAHATDRSLTHGAADDETDDLRRVALVIGNGRYQHANQLAGTQHDADAVAESLRDIGFDVTEKRDLNRRELLVAVLEFGKKLADADVGFFYYSGHGIQVDGNNYLVPVDADIPDSNYVDLDAVDVRQVLQAMQNSSTRLNIVVLDACRNNPFASKWYTRTRAMPSGGLAEVSQTTNFLIVYATSPGNVALDGGDEVGPFAGALADELMTPDREVGSLFRAVRARVIKETAQAQVPWLSVGYSDDFYLKEPPKPPPVQVGPDPALQVYRPVRAQIMDWSLELGTGAGFAYGAALDTTLGGDTYTERAAHWLVPAQLGASMRWLTGWVAVGGSTALNLSGPYLYSSDGEAKGAWLGGGASLALGLTRGPLDLGLEGGVFFPGRVPLRLVGRYGKGVGVELRLGANIAADRGPEPAIELLLNERLHLAGRRPI